MASTEEMTDPTSEDKRREDLVIDYGHGKASVEIGPHHTLADLRQLLLEEFDEDMFPGDENEQWAFWINGLRIARKQEARKMAWSCLNLELALSLRKVSNKRTSSEKAAVENEPSKRIKMEEEPASAACNTITPGHADKVTVPTVATTVNNDNDATSQLTSSLLMPSEDQAKMDNNSKQENGKEMIGKDILVDDTSQLQPQTLDGKMAKEDTPDSSNAQANTNPSVHDNDNDGDATMESDNKDINKPIPGKEEVGKQHDEPAKSEETMNDAAAQSDGKKRSDEATQVLDGATGLNDAMELEDASSTERSETKKATPKSADQHTSIEELLSDDDDDDKKMPASKDDEDDILVEVTKAVVNPHAEADAAMEKARLVLNGIEGILEETKDHELFCAHHRREEWSSELKDLRKSDRPRTIIGVLGNTGVGKSSLLNALLDEAAVLPTSGSRGCTAAVVELVFNSALLESSQATNQQEEPSQPKEVAVYRGEVEFMRLDDWTKELKLLVDECSTQEKKIYARVPDETAQPDAAAAWAKIDQVYGKGTMQGYLTQSTAYVFNRLSSNNRVRQLLTPSAPGEPYNVIPVEEGKVIAGSDKAKAFAMSYAQLSTRDRRTLKRYADSFRKSINDYVYRKGNGNLPQTWPLIRKVVLYGPWEVLSTGACLVDLPGVRDANAARAKVSETYLQNCSNICIVAPIKRAVDDGTAKELMGEQFKRRVLMDGQYGNLFFICTQTDDIEATETMRDHADVAKQVAGRWEKMQQLLKDIQTIETEQHDRLQEEEELKANIDDAVQLVKVAKVELKEFVEDSKESGECDEEEREGLKYALCDAKSKRADNEAKLKQWRDDNSEPLLMSKRRCEKLQRQLKTFCANVRNEYSRACLQEDFKNGLKDLLRNEDGDDTNAASTRTALPEDYELDVFAISSNDYMKILKIKPQSDGPPNTFSNPVDTQIPLLRNFVHETTSKGCKTFARDYVSTVGDLLDRVKLLATDSKDAPTGRRAYRLQKTFETEMKKIESKIESISTTFQRQLQSKIETSLLPSLSAGAERGSTAAMATVTSWGCKNRRSKNERRPDKNGLHHSTYNAVVRRDGEYVSPSAGEVNMNAELYEPMEKAFAGNWQSVMDASTRNLLAVARAEVVKVCETLKGDLLIALSDAGLEQARLTTMMTAAVRGSTTALNAAFALMNNTATTLQRELTRGVLPQIKEKMMGSYEATRSVPGGSGKFNRMKGAMDTTSRKTFASLFSETLGSMKRAIASMVQEIGAFLANASSVINKSYSSVFSICWDDASGAAKQATDPALQRKTRDCRDRFLPELHRLLEVQKESSALMGIQREEMDLEVMEVESLDAKIKKREEAAKKSGDAFDLCDSDAEVDVVPLQKVKAEPGTEGNANALARAARAASKYEGTSNDAIDLCGSDDEDDWLPPPKPRTTTSRIKSDPDESDERGVGNFFRQVGRL